MDFFFFLGVLGAQVGSTWVDAMKILVIETSTPRSAVAFVHDGAIRFAEAFESPRRETGPLFSVLDRAVEIGGRPDRVVVGTGPGSYNGIRIGIATAQALGMGFGVPVVGGCSLAGFSLDGADEFAVIGDARSEQVYFARIRGGVLIEGPQLLSAEAAREKLGPLAVTGPAPLATFPELIPGFPSAERLARAAVFWDPGANPPTPIYLKPAHITPQRRTHSPSPAPVLPCNPTNEG